MKTDDQPHWSGSARYDRIKAKASQIKFGGQSDDDLEAARAIASAAIDRYGEWDDDATWKRYRENGIWNDHPAVQAALRAILMMRAELVPALAPDRSTHSFG